MHVLEVWLQIQTVIVKMTMLSLAEISLDAFE